MQQNIVTFCFSPSWWCEQCLAMEGRSFAGIWTDFSVSYKKSSSVYIWYCPDVSVTRRSQSNRTAANLVSLSLLFYRLACENKGWVDIDFVSRFTVFVFQFIIILGEPELTRCPLIFFFPVTARENFGDVEGRFCKLKAFCFMTQPTASKEWKQMRGYHASKFFLE